MDPSVDEAQMGELIRFVLIGLVAGWVAGLLLRPRGVWRKKGLGILGSIAVGMVGAVIGGFLFEQLGIAGWPGFWGSVVTATVGAVVLLAIIRVARSL